MQRLALGVVQFHCCFACLNETPHCDTVVPQSIAALGGVLIMVGLWTPIAGLLVAIMETWIALSLPSNGALAAVLAVLGASLAMIGPGAWSLDAWLFGRKHIEPPDL